MTYCLTWHRRGVMLLFALLLLVLFPQSIRAQDITWEERQTESFIILFTPGDEAIADYYAGFVDTIYEDISVTFNHRTETPITMRLYPTYDRYAEVNPLVPRLPGIVAHADFRHREVAIILSETERQTPEEVQNNVRHELTHIVATDLSNNRLNTGFQEGIAQYSEMPSPSLEKKMRLLAQAYSQNMLLQWSEFDKRDVIYGTPEVSYPQTLSVIAFLVEQHGLSKLRDFLTISARSSGYRSALQRTYGMSPTDLEAAWKAWLPSYIDGGYRTTAIASYDFSYIRQLLDLGNYSEARTELEQVIPWLQSGEDRPDTAHEALQEAEQLLARSKQGEQAEQLALDTRQALEAANYAQAADLVVQAQNAYAALGDMRQNSVLDLYAERAERGLQAYETLANASKMAHLLQFPQARAAADVAASEFALLGDSLRRDEALALRRSLDSRQHMAGMVLIGLGLIGVVLSFLSSSVWRDNEVW